MNRIQELEDLDNNLQSLTPPQSQIFCPQGELFRTESDGIWTLHYEGNLEEDLQTIPIMKTQMSQEEEDLLVEQILREDKTTQEEPTTSKQWETYQRLSTETEATLTNSSTNYTTICELTMEYQDSSHPKDELHSH